MQYSCGSIQRSPDTPGIASRSPGAPNRSAVGAPGGEATMRFALPPDTKPLTLTVGRNLVVTVKVPPIAGWSPGWNTKVDPVELIGGPTAIDPLKTYDPAPLSVSELETAVSARIPGKRGEGPALPTA